MMKRGFSALYEVEDESDDDLNEANKKSKKRIFGLGHEP